MSRTSPYARRQPAALRSGKGNRRNFSRNACRVARNAPLISDASRPTSPMLDPESASVELARDASFSFDRLVAQVPCPSAILRIHRPIGARTQAHAAAAPDTHPPRHGTVLNDIRLAPAERARQQLGRQFWSFLLHLETSTIAPWRVFCPSIKDCGAA